MLFCLDLLILVNYNSLGLLMWFFSTIFFHKYESFFFFFQFLGHGDFVVQVKDTVNE